MISDQLLTILIPIAAILGSLLTFLATRRNTHRQEQADVMTGYSQLCDDYRAAITLNNEETARLRQKITDLECRFDAEREMWRLEREAMQARITELETINQRLEKQVETLQAKANGKEC